MVYTYALDGYRFAVDGNSGSIHALDEITFDMILGENVMPSLQSAQKKLGLKYTFEEIEEAYGEIQALCDEGMLYSSEDFLISAAGAKNIPSAVKALCLHVAHDCNLRCGYCFASEGDYNSGRKLMTRDVALASVDFLINASMERHNIEIDFFGGEPLMNFDVVKETVEYGRKLEASAGKHFYFTITTNGTLLDKDKIDFINSQMDNVVISLDGRKEIHDAVRCDRMGRGSYDRIVPMAQKLVAGRYGKSYFVRGTYTRHNKDFSKDVMHLADLGFREISVEPVVGGGKALHFQESDLPDIFLEYENLALQYIDRIKSGKPFRFYHFNLDLYNGPCLYKRIAACGAGYEYLAVSPDGDLFPCHQFVGQDGFVLGNVYTGLNKRSQKIRDDFRSNTVFHKESCKNCWAKLFCSGGCHANAFFSNGSIEKPNELICALQKKRIECAIMIQTALSNSNQEAIG